MTTEKGSARLPRLVLVGAERTVWPSVPLKLIPPPLRHSPTNPHRGRPAQLAQRAGQAISLYLRGGCFAYYLKKPSSTQRRSSERQVLCDCCPACREECAFEEDGDPRVWFKPVDCEEEDRSEKANPGNIKNGQRIGHLPERIIGARSGPLLIDGFHLQPSW